MTHERHKDTETPNAFREDIFRTMFRAASIGMVIADAHDRRLLHVNEKFCRITGYTHKALIGIRTPDLTHPDDRLGDDEKYQQAVRTKAAQYVCEKRYLCKDGAVMWVRENAAFILDEAGQPTRTMAVVEDITDRVLAETVARQSERRLKIFLDGIPDRVRLKDAEGRYLAASLSDAQALGASTVDEIIGKTLFDFRPETIARREMEEDREIIRSRRTLHAEHQRNDGRWYDVIKAPIWDDQGKPAGIVTVARDITDRKLIENQLRETEYRLREFLDGIPSRAWFKDAQGRYLMLNSREAEARGPQAESVIGKSASDLLPADEAAMVNEEDTRVLTDGRTLRIERQSNVNGDWMEIAKAPVRNRDGEVIGIVGVSRDISERKQAEAALRKSEGQLRALLDAIPDRAWLKDAQGRYVAVNRSTQEFFGLTQDEIVGKTVEDLYPGDMLQLINEEEAQIFGTLRPTRIERQFGLNGRWYETIKTPILAPDGSAAGLVAISRDVTERKQAEDELRAAKALAEDANRAKGEFLSHMSHEMRTPMNAILGFAELALLEHPDENQREHLSKITAASKSLLRVIDDVLDFERVNAGKLQMESMDFKISDVLRNVRDVVERSAAAKGLALRMTVAQDVPSRMKGDPGRIGQVLINLCANAVKFTAQGYVEVLVRAEPSTGTNPMLRFSVLDTGIGISAAELARLFQPFTQADSSTTRRYGGTGLGLVICKRLAELMGGRIWIESEPGVGTTVFFTMPCTPGDEPDPAQGRAREQLPAEAAALLGKRILIVDDHPTNRMLMAKLLKLAGAQSVPAESGLDALRVLGEAARMDLVLMDLRMPEMDGYEATRRIRADARWAKLPIVAVTASAATYERARCMAAGMNDVIIKPIRQAVFFAVVAAAMKHDD